MASRRVAKKMVSKKAVSSPVIRKVDHDQIYRSLVSDLQIALSESERQSQELANDAVQMAQIFADSPVSAEAKKKLETVEAELKSLEAKRDQELKKISETTFVSLSTLAEEATAAMKIEKSRERREEIRAAADEKIDRHLAEAKERSDALARTYMEKTLTLRKQSVQDLSRLRGTLVKDQVSKLEQSIDSLDEIQDSQRFHFEQTRKYKAKEKVEEKKTRLQEIEEEINSLSGSLITRKLLRPLTTSITDSLKRKRQEFEDKVGITTIRSFMSGERERKARLEELNFEKNQMITIQSMRDALTGQKESLKKIDTNGAQTEAAVQSMLSMLRGGNNLLSRVQTMSASASVDATELIKSPLQMAKAGSTYGNIQERGMAFRQIRALESLASTARRRARGLSFGIGDMILALSSVAGGITAALKGLLPTNIIGRMNAAFEGMKAWTLTKFNQVGEVARAGWELMKGLVTKGYTMVTDFFKTGIQPKIEAASKWIEEVWTAVKGFFGSKASAAVEKAKEIGTVVKSAVSGAASAGSGMVSRVVSATPAAVATTIRAAGSVVSGAATMARTGLGAAGTMAADGTMALGRIAGSAVSTASSSVMDLASRLGKSSAGAFVSRNLSRLGTLGVVLDTVGGIYQEATGNRVDSLSLAQAVFNPMSVGRFLGNKFNQKFESKMGQSFGSWIYDKLNGDPAAAQVGREMGFNPLFPARSSAMSAANSAPVRTASQNTSVPSGRGSSSPMRTSAPARTVSSVNGSIAPSSIPNNAGFDSHMYAISIGAMGE